MVIWLVFTPIIFLRFISTVSFFQAFSSIQCGIFFCLIEIICLYNQILVNLKSLAFENIMYKIVVHCKFLDFTSFWKFHIRSQVVVAQSYNNWTHATFTKAVILNKNWKTFNCKEDKVIVKINGNYTIPNLKLALEFVLPLILHHFIYCKDWRNMYKSAVISPKSLETVL